MARWLGVSEREYGRMPHAANRLASLWWFEGYGPLGSILTPKKEARQVIDAYLRQCVRGRTLSAGFEDELLMWLSDLYQPQNLARWGRPRTRRYWTLPAYAEAHGIAKGGFLKRFREMENIARELFPDRAVWHPKPLPLTEQDKERMRTRFREIVYERRDYVDPIAAAIAGVAEEFQVPHFRVGQVCRAEKAEAVAADN